MEDGKRMIMWGIVFLIVALFFIYMDKKIGFWSGSLGILSFIEIILGVKKLKS